MSIKKLLNELPEEITWKGASLDLKITKSDGVWWGGYACIAKPKIFEEIGDESLEKMLTMLLECLKENNLLPKRKTD